MEKKKCLNCGKEFETKNSRKIYCSDSCKVLRFRANHNIEEPEFLKPREKTLEKVERTRMVAKKTDNPLHLEHLKMLTYWHTEKDSLERKKTALVKEYDSIINKDERVEKAIMGAAIGGVIAPKNEALTTAVIFGLIGTLLGDIQKNDPQLINRKMVRLARIEFEIQRLDRAITMAMFNAQSINNTIASIPRFISTETEETYFESVPLEKLEFDLSLKQPEKIELGMAKKESNGRSSVMSSVDFKEKKFETYKLKEEHFDFFRGNLPIPSRIMIYGVSGQGKSTWAIDFATYLANSQGKVLYNSSEEGLGETLKRKFEGKESQHLFLSECRDFGSLKKVLNKDKYAFLFIDSINDMNITPQELKGLIDLDQKRTIVYIMQATKDGEYKGNTEFNHLADYRIRIDQYKPILEKGR